MQQFNYDPSKPESIIPAVLSESEFLIKQMEEKEAAAKFPVDVFPYQVQNIIAATNSDLNFPIDFIGASMLYAASVAIGNTHRVKVKNGWWEKPILYLAIVSPAGTNKSAPLTFAVKPIADQDKRTNKQYKDLKHEFDKYQRQKRKGNDGNAADEPEKPIWIKTIVSDFTPEALTQVHDNNRRGIGVQVDELAQWFNNFDRYNKGSEEQFWLSNWSCKPINIDRKTGEPVYIPSPSISVAGTIQNGVLLDLGKQSRTQNGFIDRILFVFPDDLKKPYWSDSEIDPCHTDNWKVILCNLLALEQRYDDTGHPEPATLNYSTEAKQIVMEWQRNNADKSNATDDDSFKGTLSKLEIYVSRFALLIELMRYACGSPYPYSISRESIQGAIKLVEYFELSALKVKSALSKPNAVDSPNKVTQELLRSLPDKFTTQEGKKVAESFQISERTFTRLLADRKYFTCVKHGEYEKHF